MPRLSILQLNTFNFHLPKKIIEFIEKNQPDIITLQEVSTGELNNCEDKKTNFLETIKATFGYDGVFAASQGWVRNDGKVSQCGNAILTKLNILDYSITFQPSLPTYCLYEHNHPYFHIEGNSWEAKNSRYEYAFEQPKNIVTALLQTNSGEIIKVVTTHLTVSYGCMETLQTIEQTRFLLQGIAQSKPIPTILAGDFNIQPQSSSIQSILSSGFKHINNNSTNSLDRTVHSLFQKEPLHKGLNVDYIFTKGFKDGSAEVLDTAGISDHAPVLGWVEL